MLVLSRKTNQSIIIGENIEIMIVDIKGDQIKIGINAPKSIKVFRKEVFDDIKNQNKESLLQNPNVLLSAKELFNKGKENKKEE